MDNKKEPSHSQKAPHTTTLSVFRSKPISMAIKRLRRNFQLSLLTVMGIFAVATVMPFAVYRFLQEQYWVFVIDLLLIVMAVAAVAYAWRTGNTFRPGLAYALTLVICCPLIIAPLGANAFLWSYAVLVGIFFLVPPKHAVVLNVIMITSTGLIGYWSDALQGNLQTLLTYYASSFSAAMLTLIFALHTHSHTQVFIRQATRDPLTGAGNRRALNNALRLAQANQQRHQQLYGVLVMDLDHFKSINDRFGHAVGDQVLIELVKRFTSNARQLDTLYRVGGEEFLLLVPINHLEGLKHLAAKLLQTVASRPFEQAGHVTLSIGGALLTAEQDWQSQIQMADDFLYQAKAKGRDRAIIDGDEIVRGV